MPKREDDSGPRPALSALPKPLLYARSTPPVACKQWPAGYLQLAGRIVIGVGAIRALRPVQVTGAQGHIEPGAPVTYRSSTGEGPAHGLETYSDTECRHIRRHPGGKIEALLG